MAASILLRPLDTADDVAAQRLLHAAFSDDPNMRWVFGADEPGYAERLAAYCEVGHEWHSAAGFPIQAAYDDQALVGVAYVMDAGADVPEDGDAALIPRLRDRCGDASTDRFLAYNDAADAAGPEEPGLCVALLAVAPGHQGEGIGGQLIEWAHARADADPGARGVLLDTGNPRNLPFYARHGFSPIGSVTLDDLVETILWRPCLTERPT